MEGEETKLPQLRIQTTLAEEVQAHGKSNADFWEGMSCKAMQRKGYFPNQGLGDNTRRRCEGGGGIVVDSGQRD